ncbi:IPExxxVDY family protein [Pontibacter vulgaris]|uniref:IPExxxVDY family protein n=1 Tax=Pontibacter vulgaris TaxID=2905679 RepID=UPI001FA73FE6|nr:IPExxxVDY family protein [Pontibacter vulgaris]
MKTLLLDISYDYDFDLYGLVSSSKEYKLAWTINQLLGLRLVKQKDLCYELVGKEQLLISNYEQITDHSIIRLMRNKASGICTLDKPYLLPDIKQFDYVLQITGAMQCLSPRELLQQLARLPLVQYVKQVDPLKLKFKENLIF